MFEAASKQWQPKPLPDLHETGAVREWLIEVIAQIPAMRQIEAGEFDELPLRATPLKEQRPEGTRGGTGRTRSDRWTVGRGPHSTRPPTNGRRSGRGLRRGGGR